MLYSVLRMHTNLRKGKVTFYVYENVRWRRFTCLNIDKILNKPISLFHTFLPFKSRKVLALIEWLKEGGFKI